MRPARIYLILCIAGTVLPLAAFFPFLREHGLDAKLFIDSMFANAVAGFVAWDVVVSSVVLWTFVLIEGRRSRVPHLWAPIAANLAVGVSLGLPLFLYLSRIRPNPSPNPPLIRI